MWLEHLWSYAYVNGWILDCGSPVFIRGSCFLTNERGWLQTYQIKSMIFHCWTRDLHLQPYFVLAWFENIWVIRINSKRFIFTVPLNWLIIFLWLSRAPCTISSAGSIDHFHSVPTGFVWCLQWCNIVFLKYILLVIQKKAN